MKRWEVWAAASILTLLYVAAWCAPFLAPYSPKTQFREFGFVPPARLVLTDDSGRWALSSLSVQKLPGATDYSFGPNRHRIQFLVEGEPYRWMGRMRNLHLFGSQEDTEPVFLLGTDQLGRDVFSRVLYGARFSLTIGLVAIAFTLLIGVVLGSVSGYGGRVCDVLLMRLVDLFLSLPALFVILGIRAVFPRQIGTTDLFWLMVLVFTMLGWASVARVVRGQVLSLQSREWVLAARAAGASHFRILTRHILPFAGNALVVQASLLIPAFILGEITLSFLGVGVQEPDASWGNLLTTAVSVRSVTRHPWLLAPAVCIVVTVLAFNLIGDELKALDRRRPLW